MKDLFKYFCGLVDFYRIPIKEAIIYQDQGIIALGPFYGFVVTVLLAKARATSRPKNSPFSRILKAVRRVAKLVFDCLWKELIK